MADAILTRQDFIKQAKYTPGAAILATTEKGVACYSCLARGGRLGREEIYLPRARHGWGKENGLRRGKADLIQVDGAPLASVELKTDGL